MSSFMKFEREFDNLDAYLLDNFAATFRILPSSFVWLSVVFASVIELWDWVSDGLITSLEATRDTEWNVVGVVSRVGGE